MYAVPWSVKSRQPGQAGRMDYPGMVEVLDLLRPNHPQFLTGYDPLQDIFNGIGLRCLDQVAL